MRNIKIKCLPAVLAALMLLLAAGVSQAATYNLKTGTVTVTMPDGKAVQMWGYGLSTGPITVPGPTLNVPAGENLTINLTNNLPVPVSIVVPGLSLGSPPVPVMDIDGRVESFTTLAAAAGGTASYTFTCRPGTFLYESGADPALQVPMGLYGAVRVYPATAGQAYDNAVSAFDREHLLVFSDVDPTLNDAVQAGTFGTPVYPSTVYYNPRYFLVNGKAFQAGDTPDYIGTDGQDVLLRLVNAGSLSYSPTLNGQYMKSIAADGFLLPFPEENIAPLLPAGSTRDVMVVNGSNGTGTLYDRRLYLGNGTARPGGMMKQLQVAGAMSGPVNVSVSAANGVSGVAQQVEANWGSPQGAAYLKNMQLQVGTGGAGSIVKLRYIRATNLLYMMNDTGSTWIGGFAPGSANTIVNSRATLNCANTTVNISGNNIRVSFNLTPAAGFTGNKGLLMYVIDNANVAVGFQTKGTWTIAAFINVAPTNVSVTAANGTAGVAQQVSAVWSDANGSADLKNMQLQVGTTATGGIIKLRYIRATNLLYVLNDAGSAWLGGFAPGSANVISNLRGSLNCATTTVTPAGNDLTVSFNLTPAVGYSGSKAMSMYVQDNANVAVGFQSKGIWNIAP
ncbi:MAG: multicopper oxidase domain-containing protein [Nitrospirae bacterium]|nr:multicopper oxidase domain-containing protein [Nitrospirota bacterium]